MTVIRIWAECSDRARPLKRTIQSQVADKLALLVLDGGVGDGETVTVDARAQDYIPYLFGQNGFAIVREAEHLIEALPDMYRHVAG